MAIAELLADVLADPVAVLYGKSQAADSLARAGPDAIDAIAAVLREGPSSQAHRVDVFEALALVLGRLAVKHRSRVKDLLADTTLAGNHTLVRWALDYATERPHDG